MLHHTVQRWAKTYLQAGHSAGLVVEDISHLTCREPPDSVPEDVRCLLGFLRPPPQEFEELLNPPLENWGNEAAGCAGLAPDPDIARSPLDEDGSPTGYGPAGATASQEEVDKAALRRIRGTIESVVALQPHWRSVHTGEPFPWISILTSSAVGLSSNKYAEDLLPRYDCEYAKPYDADNPPQSSRDMRGIANFMLLKQLQSSHPAVTSTTSSSQSDDSDDEVNHVRLYYNSRVSAGDLSVLLYCTPFASQTSDSGINQAPKDPPRNTWKYRMPSFRTSSGSGDTDDGVSGDEMTDAKGTDTDDDSEGDTGAECPQPFLHSDVSAVDEPGSKLPSAAVGERFSVVPLGTLSRHILACPALTAVLEPLLPVICIADEDNIVPLLLAALNQRRTLHITTAVVGIMYSAAAGECQVLIGWVSGVADKPELHFAIACSPESFKPAHGAYTLGSVHDSYALARFIYLATSHLLRLEERHWEEDGRHSGNGPHQSWRADAMLENLFGLEEASIRIQRWLHEVSILRDDPEAVFENTTVSSLCNPATLEWSGDPNDLLVDSPLPTRLNTLHPGIAGWSVDHQVLTVPFCPYADGNVFRYKQYAPHLEDLFAKLHLPYSPSDISHDIAPPHWTSRRGSHCATPGSLSHTAGGDAQGYPALQALAAAISVNIARYGAADMHLTSPCCIVEWQAVAQWWWIVVLGNSDRWQPDDNPRVTFTWSASVRISYTRCIEFDRLVTTFGDRSPETNTTIPLYALTRKHIEEGAINPTAHNKYLVNMDRIAHWLRVKLFPTAADQHDEMLHASYHTWSATKFLRTAAEGVNPDNPTSVLQRGARVCKRMRRRLVKYPLRGTYEAVAVIIHDFFEDFVRILGSGAASDIRAHLSIFEPEPYDGGDLGGPNPLPGSMNNNKTSLHLPLLSVTYQERGCTLENAVRNRERLACVSAARYLSMLGVVDFPVYGLSICGPCAVLSMAWVSDANEHCYVVDRNTAPYRFDLTDETGVARYVSFLAKMKAHGEQLYRRVQEAKPALIERARTEEGRKSFRWTMRAQMDDYELWLPGTEK